MSAMSEKKTELTVDGIKVLVDPKVVDDYEMLEYLVGIDEGDNQASVNALKRMFGEQYGDVKDSLRDEDGIVSTRRIGAFFFAVLNELSKNFEGS
jgi:hypothetical protein